MGCLLEPVEVPELERRYRRETGRFDLTIRYFAACGAAEPGEPV